MYTYIGAHVYLGFSTWGSSKLGLETLWYNMHHRVTHISVQANPSTSKWSVYEVYLLKSKINLKPFLAFYNPAESHFQRPGWKKKRSGRKKNASFTEDSWEQLTRSEHKRIILCSLFVTNLRCPLASCYYESIYFSNSIFFSIGGREKGVLCKTSHLISEAHW